MHLPSARKRVLERLRPYLETLERLYRAVAATSGARVIVDSSKSPAYGHLLGRIAGLDLRVLHLVRDPRATSHSWTRKKLFTPEGAAPVSMERRPPARSALQWNARNLLTEVYARPNAQGYLRLRYEDLVARPEPALRKVLELVGESADLGFVDGSSVEMRRRCHSVFGNLARFDEGTVALRPDERWKQEMRPLQKGVVTAMTLPLLLRYGYSLAG